MDNESIATEPENGQSEPAEKPEELKTAEARIAELEEAIAGKDNEIAGLQKAVTKMEENLSMAGDSLSGVVAAYKSMAARANPDVMEELIIGDTIESVDESLERAKALVSRVRQGVEEEISMARVPAGAPERAAPDLTAMSPREKIQYAIETPSRTAG